MDDRDVHKDCFRFQRDFDTKQLRYEPFGRLFLGGGHCIRIVLGPKGLVASISQEAINEGFVIVSTLNPIEVK